MFSLVPKTIPPGFPPDVKIYLSAFTYVIEGLYLNNLVPVLDVCRSITKPELPAELINSALISLAIYIPLQENPLYDIIVLSVALKTMRS